MVEATCRYIEVRLNLAESLITNFVTANVLLYNVYNAFDTPKTFLATFFFTHAKASIIYLLGYFSKPKLSQNHKSGHSSSSIQPFVTCPLAVDQRCYGVGASIVGLYKQTKQQTRETEWKQLYVLLLTITKEKKRKSSVVCSTLVSRFLLM